MCTRQFFSQERNCIRPSRANRFAGAVQEEPQKSSCRSETFLRRRNSMSRRNESANENSSKDHEARVVAGAAGQTLTSHTVGALPILNSILQRLRLEEFLQQALPPDNKRVRVPTAQGLLVLVRNVLVSREPIYGVREW